MAYPHQNESNAPALALVFGILSLFILGLLFGPLAIWQAGKAERDGSYNGLAVAGKVLGWIGLILSLLGLFGACAVLLS